MTEAGGAPSTRWPFYWRMALASMSSMRNREPLPSMTRLTEATPQPLNTYFAFGPILELPTNEATALWTMRYEWGRKILRSYCWKENHEKGRHLNSSLRRWKLPYNETSPLS